MSVARITIIAAVIFTGFLQLLLTIHHAVKIRLGDTQEGWSLTFVFWLFLTPIIMALLLEIARQIKD